MKERRQKTSWIIQVAKYTFYKKGEQWTSPQPYISGKIMTHLS